MSQTQPKLTAVPTSVVEIKNLQLSHPVLRQNVWGHEKEQPCSLTVALELLHPFTASSDDLENSIHYGNLAKSIRASIDKTVWPNELLRQVEELCLRMGDRPAGQLIQCIKLELYLPKASMTGDCLVLCKMMNISSNGDVSATTQHVSVKKMRCMALIGINDYERKAKQPIVADLDFEIYEFEDAFDVERAVQSLIEHSSFETLEALAATAGEELKKHAYGIAWMRIRLEKPKAIPFADAAVVELFMPFESRQNASATIAAGSDLRQSSVEALVQHTDLRIVRPYT